MSELRKDIVTREWVILATERAKRPHDFESQELAKELPEADPKCPFCPGNESMTPPELLAYREGTSGPNEAGWRVRVTANKFPALKRDGELNRNDVSIYDMMEGIGAHEVIIETPIHNKTICQLADGEVEDVIRAYRDRYEDLRGDPRLKYIQIFRNHGEKAGCSLAHAHSQIVATPIIPQKVWSKVKGVEQYREYRQACVYCDIVERELALKKRLVTENAMFIAIAPFASRSPFQVKILPRFHASCFHCMKEGEIIQFAHILKDVLLRLYHCLQNPPYNYTFHTAPCEQEMTGQFHWHLEITPRLTTPAGLELGTSIYINATPPEDAARYLREVSV